MCTYASAFAQAGGEPVLRFLWPMITAWARVWLSSASVCKVADLLLYKSFVVFAYGVLVMTRANKRRRVGDDSVALLEGAQVSEL